MYTNHLRLMSVAQQRFSIILACAAVVYVVVIESTSTTHVPFISSWQCPLAPPAASSNVSEGGGGVGSCSCPRMTEIHCRGGLTALPLFIRADYHDQRHRHHARPTFDGFYAAGQSVAEVRPSAFAELSVRRIVLDFNPLGDGLSEDAFRGAVLGRTLRELHLGACHLRALPPRLIADLVELRRLHLWANSVDAIPPDFFIQAAGGGRNIEELIMWGNALEEIEERTFEGLLRLRRLDLDRNRIHVINIKAFGAIPELESLRLAGNNIHVVYEATFLALTNLKVLNLDRNGLGFVYSDAFCTVSRLLSLSLSENAISFLPDSVFSRLSRLRLLRLADNRLEYVWAGTFAGLSSLTSLDLSGNRLARLSAGVFSQAAGLVHLRLDRNRLRAVDRCALATVIYAGKASALLPLRTLTFVGNEGVPCDCDTAWMAVELQGGPRRTAVWGACADGRQSLVRIIANDTEKCALSLANDNCVD